jgi:hypothetical protein
MCRSMVARVGLVSAMAAAVIASEAVKWSRVWRIENVVLA